MSVLRRIAALALLLGVLASAAQAQGPGISSRVGPGATTGLVPNPGITYSGTAGNLTFSLSQAASYIDGTFSAELAAAYEGDTQPAVTVLNLGSVTRLGTLTTTAWTVLTTISAPSLTSAVSLTTSSNNGFTSLSLPVLRSIGTLAGNSSGVTSLSLPALVTLGVYTPSLAGLTSFSAPLLTTATGTFSPSMAALTSLSLPTLTSIGGNFSGTYAALTTLSLPALASVTLAFNPTMATLTTLSLPALVSVGTTMTITAVNMTTVSFGSTLKSVGGNFSLAGAKLTQASVDAILVSLAALDGTNGTTAYSSKSVTLTGGTNATPSATGLAAKATLVARSCTVTNN